MPKVDIIEYKIQNATPAFLFVSAIANKSTAVENISIFEKLNINQLGLAKNNLYFNELFYI